jgi:ABC-type polysaccharide/polyol phosphate export permease
LNSTWPNILSRRDLIRELTLSELRSRSAETRLGWVWWLVDPLIMMLIYWGVVVGIFGRGQSYTPYPVFILCALLPWKHFQSGLTHASKVLRNNEGLIKSIAFPTMILPLTNVIAGFAYFLFGVVVLVAAALLFELPIGASVIQLPALMAFQLLLVTSFSLVATSFGALIRDLSGFLTHVLRVGFYFSPTLYGVDMVRERVAGGAFGDSAWAEWIPTLYMLNPFAILIHGYRQALFFGGWLEPRWWGVLAVEAMVLFAIGQRVYRYFDKRVIKFL